MQQLRWTAALPAPVQFLIRAIGAPPASVSYRHRHRAAMAALVSDVGSACSVVMPTKQRNANKHAATMQQAVRGTQAGAKLTGSGDCRRSAAIREAVGAQALKPRAQRAPAPI